MEEERFKEWAKQEIINRLKESDIEYFESAIKSIWYTDCKGDEYLVTYLSRTVGEVVYNQFAEYLGVLNHHVFEVATPFKVRWLYPELVILYKDGKVIEGVDYKW